MKKVFHKNQLIITALALLIAVAGYISYDKVGKKTQTEVETMNQQIALENTAEDSVNTPLHDALDASAEDLTSASSDDLEEENIVDMAANIAQDESIDESVDAATGEDVIENPGETVLTSSIVNVDDYAAGVKLNREQVRSKNRESLSEIINNANLSDEQKQTAVDQMVAMTDIAEKEANAEMLLEAKGFTDVVVSISDGSCDVVVNMDEVTDAKLAQVEDIVKRKTNINAENIVITPIEVTP